MFGRSDSSLHVEHLKKMIDVVGDDLQSTTEAAYPKHGHIIAFSYCSGYMKGFERCGFISQSTYDELLKTAAKRFGVKL